LLGAFISQAAVLAAFSLPVLRQLNSTIPTYPCLPDEKLIVWILSWVAHALADPTLAVFDGNIFHPAPGQLTGSTHLFAVQTLFAPIYLWTKEPLLSTAIVAALTYPLAAVLMTALLVRCGCTRLTAWLFGLVYAVGLLRVPFNFHVLQYPNLLLPLVAIGLVQVRDSPRLWSGALLFTLTLAALLTSYYVAIIAALGLGCWVLAELIDRRPRLGFLLIVTFTTVAAAAVTAYVLRPYFERSALMEPPVLPWLSLTDVSESAVATARFYQELGFPWIAAFALLAFFAFLRPRERSAARLLLPAVLLVVLVTIMTVIGLPGWLGEIAALTPLRHFRAWLRLLVLADFAFCLLAAVGLDALRSRYGRGVAAFPIALVVALTVPRMQALEGETVVAHPMTDRRAAYKSLEFFAALAPGPVLELPFDWHGDSEAMLASTLHWRPLVNGFTGYPPPHFQPLRAALRRLPRREAVQRIYDLTHLDWIILRPVKDWKSPEERARMYYGLKASGFVTQSFEVVGFTLMMVKLKAVHDKWYGAIAAGIQPGKTILGTPLRPLTIDGSAAIVRQIGEVAAGREPDTIRLRVEVRNEGETTWPALGSLPVYHSSDHRTLVPFEVYIETRWTRLDQAGGARGEPLTESIQFSSDMPPGERVTKSFSVVVPTVPGTYRFDVRVVQKDGIEFYEPPSRMVHGVYEILEVDEADLTGE